MHSVLAQRGMCKNGPGKRTLTRETALMNEREHSYGDSSLGNHVCRGEKEHALGLVQN